MSAPQRMRVPVGATFADYWLCPKCNHYTLHVSTRSKCWLCGYRGAPDGFARSHNYEVRDRDGELLAVFTDKQEANAYATKRHATVRVESPQTEGVHRDLAYADLVPDSVTRLEPRRAPERRAC